MTNEENAQILDLLADDHDPAIAALLRESAALWRDRHPDDALWELEYQRRYKRFDLCVGEGYDGKWYWTASRSGLQSECGSADTLKDAQAAAIQWVDQREGE
jgi:hypothetical protein